MTHSYPFRLGIVAVCGNRVESIHRQPPLIVNRKALRWFRNTTTR
jgi:hypothetical protein